MLPLMVDSMKIRHLLASLANPTTTPSDVFPEMVTLVTVAESGRDTPRQRRTFFGLPDTELPGDRVVGSMSRS